MSTLRISNIEAKADSSSPTVDEQLKFTNSDGDVLLHLDGRTAGITTVGINTTNSTVKFDANNNILITGIVTATEFHGTLAVGTSVTYGDNEKAYFGNGLDMSLYHDGTNSYLKNNTNNFNINTTGSFVVASNAGANVGLVVNPSGATSIRYANSVKLATTNTGAVVTGILTATGNLHADNAFLNSGLTINNNSNVSINLTSTSTSGSSRIFFGDPDSALVGRLTYSHNGDYMQFFTAYGERLRIQGNGNVGIGTDNPLQRLHVKQGSTTTPAMVEALGAKSHVKFQHNAGNSYTTTIGSKTLGSGNVGLTFDTGYNGAVQRMTIDVNGRIGIGTELPQTMHHLFGSSGLYTRFESAQGQVNFGNSNGAGVIHVTSTSEPFRILVNGNNERFRIASDGRTMIGTTVPSSNPAAYMLTVADPNNSLGNSGITIRAATGVSGGTHQGSIFYSNATSGAGEYAGYLQYNHNDNWFRIGVGSAEKLRIDSSGRLRVASTTESADGAFDDVIVGNHSGNRGISILSGATSQGALGFAKSGTLADGYVAYNHNSTATSSSMVLKSSGIIKFNAGSVERLRIKSDGKVVIGNNSGSGTGALTIYPNSITGNGRLDVYGGGDENAQSASKNEVMRIGRGDILDQYYHSIWSATGSGGSNSHFLKFYVSNGNAGATNQLEALSMNGDGYVTKPQHPAFKCSIGSDTSPNSGIVSENNGFTLNSTSGRDAFNKGSHFDEATGRFTAPVTGLYFFHFSVMRHGGNGGGPIEMRIKKNGGTMWARAYKSTYSVNYQSDNVTTITNMTAGHYVEFMIGSNMSVYFDDSYMLGYLIG